MAKPGTGATTKVMWRKLRYSQLGCEFFDHMPDDLFCHPITPDDSRPRNTSKLSPTSHSCCREPIINDLFDPVWNGHGSNMACFPKQVNDGPAIFALLQMIDPQFSQFMATQPAAE